jgi:hypothetical protein
MKLLPIAFLLISSLHFHFCNAQERFPSVQCENLNGEYLSIPNSIKHQIIILAFGKQNEKELESWLQPLYDKFIAKTGLIDLMFDADVYLLSVLNGIEANAVKSNIEKIKKQTDAELHANMLFLKDANDKILQTLKPDTKHLQIYLVDSNGKIVFHTQGNLSDEKMEALEDAFD